MGFNIFIILQVQGLFSGCELWHGPEAFCFSHPASAQSIKSSFRLPSSWLTAGLGKRPRLTPTAARSPADSPMSRFGRPWGSAGLLRLLQGGTCVWVAGLGEAECILLFFFFGFHAVLFFCGQAKSLTEAKMGTVKFCLAKINIKKIVKGVGCIHLFICVFLYLCWHWREQREGKKNPWAKTQQNTLEQPNVG